MIDPTDFSTVNDSIWNLEESLIFWMCVAGKPADVTARKVDDLLTILQAQYVELIIDTQAVSTMGTSVPKTG